jgi:hypothetical protein
MTEATPYEKAMALAALEPPEVRWVHGDDLCDCTFQRIGEWMNPYLGKSMTIRFCCVWEKFREQWPDLFMDMNGYWDENDQEYKEAIEWNAEYEMPRAIWYRQIQALTGKSLPDIRDEYGSQDPPQGVPRPKPQSDPSKVYINLRGYTNGR